MTLFILTWFFILGAVIGSFLNVVILRMRTGRSLAGRSHCLSCGSTLAFFELVPVFSWIAFRGRCRHCTAVVSRQYLVVELATAGLFVWIAHVFWPNPIILPLALAVGVVLVVTFVYDIRHTIVPDGAVLILLALAILLRAAEGVSESAVHLTDYLGWVPPVGVLFALWYGSRGRWLGLGDVKLALPLGLMLDLSGGTSLLFFAFWIGALVALSLLALQYCLRRGQLRIPFLSASLTMKSEVPFAPFLVIAFLLVWLTDTDALALVSVVTDTLVGI